MTSLFRERPLPAIHIKRRDLSKSPPLLTKLDTSQFPKHKSFRKTFSKATSKIFSRKSVASKTLSNPNTVVDVTNPNAVSGAGTRNESTGNRTSVASSTDTGDDHDTDIDDPAPLPPPRPRHWAKRAKEQSMVPEGNSNIPGKIADEDCKADDPSSPSDWSRSVPQFPLPTFKPTMQSKFIYRNLMQIDLLSMNRQVIHRRLVHLGKIVNLICYFVETSVGSLKAAWHSHVHRGSIYLVPSA